MRNLVFGHLGVVAGVAVVFALLSVATANAEIKIPAGLFDQDPMVRLRTIEQVKEQHIQAAEDQLANMVQNDPHANVREAACSALAVLWSVSRIELLRNSAATDPNAAVRSAAARAVLELEGRLSNAGQPLAAQTPKPLASKAQYNLSSDPEKYRQPELTLNEDEIVERPRNFAIGIGTMGGLGIASLDLRGTIPTKSEYLPWIGIEVGGGWTPPEGYVITAGPIEDINNTNNKWRIFSVAGSVLLFLHRMHYIPVRAGWDRGRGMYAILGYGFEQLNQEGFFSWGVEVGILYQPIIDKRIDNLVKCEEGDNCSSSDLWPVIPYVRFVLHFYPV